MTMIEKNGKTQMKRNRAQPERPSSQRPHSAIMCRLLGFAYLDLKRLGGQALFGFASEHFVFLYKLAFIGQSF
jgi:hypothetical protein